MKRTAFIMGMVVGSAFVSPLRAEITAEMVMVGFPNDLGTQPWLYRGGCYAPLAIRLSMKGEPAKTVYLRLEQRDLDGDIVYSDEFVNLTPELEGSGRLYWLYFVPNPETGHGVDAVAVQVLDENHEAIEVASNGRKARKVSLTDIPDVVQGQHFLVLSISKDTAGKLRSLGKETLKEGKFTKELRVSHISPERIPDSWHGLEMVDAIVWDAADAGDVTLQQQQALVEWVRQGGRLIVASGGTSDTLTKSEIGKILPVDIKGVTTATSLPELRGWSLSRGNPDVEEYPQPMQVTQCTVRPGAQDLVPSAAKTRTYLARSRFGNGTVTYLPVTFRDLLRIDELEKSNLDDFFRRLLGLRIGSKDDHARQAAFQQNTIDLLGQMRGLIDFAVTTAAYMFIAILFVIAYALIATWGSWFVLRARNMLRYSWTAFAVVALIASVLGLGAVQIGRGGLGFQLHQVTVVDATADRYDGVARAYFGLKTSNYVQDMDLWLPQTGLPDQQPDLTSCILRPLSPIIGGVENETRFADTRRYPAVPAHALLENVPIRATLKQLEGYWHGDLRGRIKADVRLQRNAATNGWVVSPDSTLQLMDFGHDLKDCMLILSPQLDTDNFGPSRNSAMSIHPIGDLKDNEAVDLYSRMYRYVATINPDEAWRELERQRQLDEQHRKWVADLKAMTSSTATKTLWATLLLTTFNEYVPDSNPDYYGIQTAVSSEYAQWMDRSNVIQPDTALLVGVAVDDPGPVQLFYRSGAGEFKYLKPKESLVVYRVTIPVQRPGLAERTPNP